MKHVIAVLAAPGVQLLDVAGPLDVFAEANRVLNREVYVPLILTLEPGAVCSSSGIEVAGNVTITEAHTIDVDTFLVAGMPDASRWQLQPDQASCIQALCQKSRRYGSVCTGAFVLASTGMLSGRTVATHWAYADLLASTYPDLSVDSDALYINDGPVRTAAGVTSGMDLALRLVEEDLGREVASDIAGNLVMYFRRPANQGQFTRNKNMSLSGRSTFQELQRWALGNLEQVKNIQDLAAHMGVSVRHLNRIFHQEQGMTAGDWLERAKIAAAREKLENTDLPLKLIAGRVGYSSVDIFRKAFLRKTGSSPAMYRKMHGRA
jgi:Transcriptional regulator containing an amidase domain and an AraC-type DNA-binding HTH domain